MKTSLIITLSLLLLSCSNDNNNLIEQEILGYFNSFESEAFLRGVEIDLDNIDLNAYVENIEKTGVVGQCNSYSDGSKTVVVDEFYWSNASDLDKEYLTYHELGHCVLERDHNDEKDQQGDCKSIMQSGLANCKSNYNTINRDELLDELFDQ